MISRQNTLNAQPLSPWTPSERSYLINDLCRHYARASANEGWFRQSWLGVELSIKGARLELFSEVNP